MWTAHTTDWCRVTTVRRESVATAFRPPRQSRYVSSQYSSDVMFAIIDERFSPRW